MEYKVIYEIGGRLFKAKGTFASQEEANKLKEYLLKRKFDVLTVEESYEHNMHYSPEKLRALKELKSRLESFK